MMRDNVQPMLRYAGRYPIFDATRIETYPVAGRPNKVKLDDLMRPAAALEAEHVVTPEQAELIDRVAGEIVEARKAERPVVVITGAHLIKNGLGPLVFDLIQRKAITLVATNGAGAIHDFELALFGQTSEHVPNALPAGQFGMAYEFAYQNEAINVGHAMDLGYGESLGRMICDREFRRQVLERVHREGAPEYFKHPDVSVLAAAYQAGVPLTVHASIGTDVLDQHPNFDASAKGAASGRDFLIFTQHMAGFTQGGVVVNIGSAVTGPEVLLKAVSMVGNVGKAPTGLVTADFDIRPHDPGAMADESKAEYYYRDQKSIVTRVPQAFGGRGYYVQGNQKATIPALYKALRATLR